MFQIDNHSNFVHPAHRRVRVVSQILRILLTSFGGLEKAVVGPKLVPVKVELMWVTRQRKIYSPSAVEPTLPTGER